MTFDIDEGTLTLSKDGQRLGIMKDNLSGEFCLLVRGEATLSQGHTRVSIERGKNRRAFNTIQAYRANFSVYPPIARRV